MVSSAWLIRYELSTLKTYDKSAHDDTSVIDQMDKSPFSILVPVSTLKDLAKFSKRVRGSCRAM